MTRTGIPPRIIVVALVSLDIARTLARICRRRRSTSARLASVSARLPPVSRCTLSAMIKKRNSGTSMREAMSHNRVSRSRPMRIPASTRPSSSPTGSAISWPAPMIASLIGSPERNARTIRSIASGKSAIKAATRRFPIRPTILWGSAMPISSPSKRLGTIPSGAVQAITIADSAATPTHAIAYWPTLMARPERARRAASTSRRGQPLVGDRGRFWVSRSAAGPATVLRGRSGGNHTLSPVAHSREAPLEAHGCCAPSIRWHEAASRARSAHGSSRTGPFA